jgi:hypothetical protein
MRAARKARHAEALIDSLARAQTLARQFAKTMSGLKIANGDTLTIQDGVILPIGQNLEYAMSLARGRDRDRIRAALNFVAALQEILDHSHSGVGSRASVDASFVGAVSIQSRHLEHACDTALSCALRLDRVSSPAVVPGRHGTSRIVPSAARLLSYAARFLPVGNRARYTEEFRSELWDLAATGAGRRGQLIYAIRQAGSVLRLRLELRSPRRQGAVP